MTVHSRGLVRVARAAHGRAYPRLIGTLREPSWLFYETILPLLGTIAFVYVYRSLHAPERFIGYVIMGGATTAVWLNIMWMMASQLWWEKQEGNLELYMVAPCGLGPILLGMSIGGFFMSSVRGGAVVLIGMLLFHVHYTITQIPMFFAVFGVTVIALYGLGVALASLFLMWGREAWHLTNMFLEPVYLVSGVYFPVRALGYWAGLGASLIPLTLALDSIRQLLYPHTHPRLLPVSVELGMLCGLAVAFFVLARAMLRVMERRARQDGTLSVRM